MKFKWDIIKLTWGCRLWKAGDSLVFVSLLWSVDTILVSVVMPDKFRILIEFFSDTSITKMERKRFNCTRSFFGQLMNENIGWLYHWKSD